MKINNLNNLKNLKSDIEINFEKIIILKTGCDDNLKIIEEMINRINIKHSFLINNINKNENTEIPFYLGIDSLNFQKKLYVFKLDNLIKNYNKVFNCIYRDYYKIHKIIKNYITTNTNINPKTEIFSKYKDLEDDKEYNFEETIKIQNTILFYIEALLEIVNNKHLKLFHFINSNKAGYAVNNYINEENTNIQIFLNKSDLYLNYLNTANKYHNNFLDDLNNQCNFIINAIESDIDFTIEVDISKEDEQINKEEKEENNASEKVEKNQEV